MIKDKKTLICCLFIGLSGIAVFYLIPFIIGFVNSFIVSSDNINKIGFDNYIRLFKNETFKIAIVNTLVFSVTTVVLINLISFAVASFIKSSVKNNFLLNMIILPMAIPTIIITTVFNDVLINSIGKFISTLSGSYVDMMRGEFAFLSVVLIYLWKYTGFNTLIYLTALKTVPPMQYEAASLDGASYWKKLRYITLPCIFPFICFNTILAIINSFRMFRDIYILFGNYPSKNVYLLQHFIQNNFSTLNLDYVFCAAYVFFIVLFIIYVPLITKGNITEKYYDE